MTDGDDVQYDDVYYSNNSDFSEMSKVGLSLSTADLADDFVVVMLW